MGDFKKNILLNGNEAKNLKLHTVADISAETVAEGELRYDQTTKAAFVKGASDKEKILTDKNFTNSGIEMPNRYYDSSLVVNHNDGTGEFIKIPSLSGSADGQIYVLQSTGWVLARNDQSYSAKSLMGVYIHPGLILVKGFFGYQPNIPTIWFHNTSNYGEPIYMGISGYPRETAPTSGTVRVIGVKYSQSIVYFDFKLT